jgi:hypothetical protein
MMAFGMDDSQAPGAPESRSGAFGVGQAEAVINADSAKFNAMVPKGPQLNSVLQPPRASSNGMGQGDYARLLPGMTKPLPSFNGQSPGNAEKSLMIRLQGGGV